MCEDKSKPTEDEMKLIKQKLDPLLQDIVNATTATLPVIVQTVDGMQEEDKEKVDKLQGKIKDNLYIINAYSADLSTDAIKEMIKVSRVIKIFYDAEVRAV